MCGRPPPSLMGLPHGRFSEPSFPLVTSKLSAQIFRKRAGFKLAQCPLLFYKRTAVEQKTSTFALITLLRKAPTSISPAEMSRGLPFSTSINPANMAESSGCWAIVRRSTSYNFPTMLLSKQTSLHHSSNHAKRPFFRDYKRPQFLRSSPSRGAAEFRMA